ncbi:hypothetical protein ACVWZ8_004376 [Arthrobacter sp. UYCu723]
MRGIVPRLYDRRLALGRVRVCQSPASGLWWAERRLPIFDGDIETLGTHQCKVFNTHAEAIAQATAWAPKKAAKP